MENTFNSQTNNKMYESLYIMEDIDFKELR